MSKRQMKTDKKTGKSRPKITMHSPRCEVCKSDYRREIEEAFVAWQVPEDIGKIYGVSGDSVKRHALAFNLRKKRDKNIRGALTQIIHSGMMLGAPVKPETIVSAAKLRAQLDGDFVEKREEKHTIDLSKSMQRRTDRLVDAIGGKPDDVHLGDITDE